MYVSREKTNNNLTRRILKCSNSLEHDYEIKNHKLD